MDPNRPAPPKKTSPWTYVGCGCGLLQRHLLRALLELEALHAERHRPARHHYRGPTLRGGRQVVAEQGELPPIQRWRARLPGRSGEDGRAELDHRPAAPRKGGTEGVGHSIRRSKCSKGARVLHTRPR